MYDVALSVASCVRSGTDADVAWIVSSEGLEVTPAGEAMALTPGGGRIGHLAGGALDALVADLVASGGSNRLSSFEIDPVTSVIEGLPTGSRAVVVSVSAALFPAGFFDLISEGRPVCAVLWRDGAAITKIDTFQRDEVAELGEILEHFFMQGINASMVEEQRVVTAVWPVPRLAIIGTSPICEAVCTAAGPLGWQVLRYDGPAEASAHLLGFGPIDMVLVGLHEVEAAGNALIAALSGNAGYIGALGSRSMAEARRDWLRRRNITDLDRIFGPAGLDLGASRPAEIAIAIIAEALLARSVGSRPTQTS